MALFVRDTKLNFLADDKKPAGGEARPVVRWYERLREIVLRNPDPASRSYRYMSRLIEREFPHGESGVCLAFSSTDDDKKSTNAVLMLAYCLRSELDSRVLIVDARLKGKPDGVTGRLGLQDSAGFAEFMLEGTEVGESLVVPSPVEGVDVLPSGRAGRSGQVALDRVRLNQLLDAVKARYDHVLVQVGSVLRDTRNVLTVAETDVVFLLVEENESFMKSLDDSRQLLLSNGVTNVRVVVTGRGS